MRPMIVPIPALIAACSTHSPNTVAKATSPDPGSVALFFEALKASDPAQVERLLTAEPSLAGARRPDGVSAVLLALSTRSGEGFVPPQENPMLRSILNRHPGLNPFEAAGVGDLKGVSAALDRDPEFIRAFHPSPVAWTALHFAAFGGQLTVADLLISRGADLNARARTKFQNTPLQVALLTRQVQVAKTLVARGADVTVKQAEGFTALHEAALLGNDELVALLLDAGADVNAASEDGRTPLSVALHAKHSGTAALLRQRGAQK